MRGRVSARRVRVRARDRSKAVTSRTTSWTTERASLDDENERDRDERGTNSNSNRIEFAFHSIRISIDFESRAVAENANARWGAIESIRVSFARRVCARVIAFKCVLSAFFGSCPTQKNTGGKIGQPKNPSTFKPHSRHSEPNLETKNLLRRNRLMSPSFMLYRQQEKV